MECPWGGGQSCIVARRRFEDFVHEDDVFADAGIPPRRNCTVPYTPEQKVAIERVMGGE